MVCLGNICRSPLAEGIMKHKLQQAGIDAHVDSAGLLNYHTGSMPDKRSVNTAGKHGIDITYQRARCITKSDIHQFDYILAMDKSNYENLLEYADKGEESRISLILDFAGLGKKEVPDPYYGNAGDFENVYYLLDDACQRIVDKLKISSSLNLV
ncbi:MAG: Low molecular weight protein-tyrosine-phosphatase YfkJ [Bacteroidetes bacterium ADurb.Bin141]|nr:low molecular weight phosphotyrosine protein phosphatase [Bacteroidia bacterium]OQB65240.1 MAG: Low molecular weight protein-tyrosine-phosphatase YfkJ [Bacteroidetes bacterium ADurb.Bin141]